MSDIVSNFLSGVLVILVLLTIMQWYKNKYSCDSNRIIMSCGCKVGNCRCIGKQSHRHHRDGFADSDIPRHGAEHVTGSGPTPPITKTLSTDYSGTSIKEMSLETEVDDSHQRWCDQLSFAGLPTGASSCTTLEETGRSYGTADFVGLTARKFCKARQYATPAPDARFTPSQNIVEWCNMPTDSLI